MFLSTALFLRVLINLTNNKTPVLHYCVDGAISGFILGKGEGGHMTKSKSCGLIKIDVMHFV